MQPLQDRAVLLFMALAAFFCAIDEAVFHRIRRATGERTCGGGRPLYPMRRAIKQ